MSVTVDFRVLELLCGRLCHELISPIGAINNGVELLGEDDEDFVRDAMALIGQSGRKAGQRLQFYRFAYGASVTAGGTPGGGAPNIRELTAGLLDGGKVTCEWSAEAAALPAAWQKLACNMLVLAAEALPRGGSVTIAVPTQGQAGLKVTAVGAAINFTAEIRAAMAADADVHALTSRTIQSYFTARLAETVGTHLAADTGAPDRLVLAAAAT
jgi:histidine phosphotransferase ChpT